MSSRDSGCIWVYGECGAKSIQTFGDHAQKKSTRYREQRPEQVEEYLQQIADVPADGIAYVDETGIDTYIHREYGWSERSKPLVAGMSGRKFKRTSVVAAQMGRSIFSPMQYQGTMDSTLFEWWFDECFLPSLPPKTVIVMDNASFHRKSKLMAISGDAGFRLVFLPPHSPEFNSIEHFWAWIKRFLRKTLSAHSSFDVALCSAFQVR